jgi:hypothetical protein
VYSGKGVQDLRSITAYVTEGKASYVVNDNGTYSLSNDSTSLRSRYFLLTPFLTRPMALANMQSLLEWTGSRLH